MSDIKVMIGIPVLEQMKMQTSISLLQMIINTKVPTEVVFAKDSLIHEARWKLVLQAQEIKSSHILFMDSDMEVEGDIINKLLADNKDIVGVNSHAKILPIRSTVKLADEYGNIVQGEVPKELFKCYAVGTGLMLVNTNVFNRISKPWFAYKFTEDGDPLYGEDVWFCEQAHKAEIEVWCDPKVFVRHVGDYEY